MTYDDFPAFPDTLADMSELPDGYATFAGTEGRIAFRGWELARPRYLCLLAHGYGEHMGRYDYVGATLQSHGAAVYGPDHIGHGHSDGDRALITDFEHVVSDLHSVAELATSAHPGLPVVLIGHSLGGLIAARYTQRYAEELRALVLSGPVLGEWPEATDLLALPAIPDDPLDSSTLSRDLSVGSAYVRDPLVYHGPFKEQMLRAIAGTLHVVNTGASLGDLPTLWLHGDADTLVPLRGSTLGIEALAPAKLTTRIYGDARHEVFNETNRDQVLGDVTSFIDGVL